MGNGGDVPATGAAGDIIPTPPGVLSLADVQQQLLEAIAALRTDMDTRFNQLGDSAASATQLSQDTEKLALYISQASESHQPQGDLKGYALGAVITMMWNKLESL